MKALFMLGFITVSLVTAQAQSTPPARDYKRLIREIAVSCPTVFDADGNFHNAPVTDAFRRQIISYFAAELNKRDGDGKWGVLYRMDRQDETPEPGRLTTDVVIWIPGRLHYDTMGDKNVAWSLIGPLPNDTDWFIHDPLRHPTVCGRNAQPPSDPPTQPQPSSDVEQRLRAIEDRLNRHVAP